MRAFTYCWLSTLRQQIAAPACLELSQPGTLSPPGMGVPLFNAKENSMFTVPMSQTLRRVPYLLGGAAVHYAPSMPRQAVPALLRPLPSAQPLLAAGCRGH